MAHGGNDVSNAIGPYAVLLQYAVRGEVSHPPLVGLFKEFVHTDTLNITKKQNSLWFLLLFQRKRVVCSTSPKTKVVYTGSMEWVNGYVGRQK